MVYVRHLSGGAPASRDEEVELAMLWTELAFELEDIGLDRLAKRCNISGRYWSNPAQFGDDFLVQAGIRLEDIERLARVSLSELKLAR